MLRVPFRHARTPTTDELDRASHGAGQTPGAAKGEADGTRMEGGAQGTCSAGVGAAPRGEAVHSPGRGD
eukprot:scaffold13683_cov101-Isochrysis_galbana.AAC.2